MEVLNEIEPSAMREVFVEVPNMQWQDIGGLSSIKQELQEIAVCTAPRSRL